MVGMGMNTSISMNIEASLLDDVAEIINDIRLRGLVFDREIILNYLNQVNQAIKMNNLNYIKMIVKSQNEPAEEMRAHYITSAFTHIFGGPLLKLWTPEVQEQLTETFKQNVFKRYKLEDPLTLEFRKVNKNKKTKVDGNSLEGVVGISIGADDLDFSRKKTAKKTITEIEMELNRLSGMLNKEYTEPRHLAFSGLNNFALPLLGGYTERSKFYEKDYSLREKHGEYLLRLPNFYED